MIYFNNVKMTRKDIVTYKDGKELKKPIETIKVIYENDCLDFEDFIREILHRSTQDIHYEEKLKVSFELEEQF
mgnify:CR=1 FL=1